MTIVAGFQTNDGAVMAADSAEIISDYAKTTTHKIKIFHHGSNWRVGFAGSSGDASYLELFQEELFDQLRKIDEYNFEKMVSIIKAALHRVHKQHIWPHEKSSTASMQTMLVLQCVAEPKQAKGLIPHLLTTHGSVLMRANQYKSVGVGTYMAEYLKDSLCQGLDEAIPMCSVEQMANVSVLMLKEIKKAVHGCDGETAVAIFHSDGRYRCMPTEEIKKVEAVDDSFHKAQAKVALALCNLDVSEDKLLKVVNDFGSDLEKIRAKRKILVRDKLKILQKLISHRIDKKIRGDFIQG